MTVDDGRRRQGARRGQEPAADRHDGGGGRFLARRRDRRARPGGREIARGLANYASAEARLLCRKPSGEIEQLLGYVAEPEMIHRTNLVLTASAVSAASVD